MSDWKKYKSVAAAKRAKSLYFKGSDGKKKVAVYKEELDKWKKKNKGAYKGSALAAWTKTKGKDIIPLRPKIRPYSADAKAVHSKTKTFVEKYLKEEKIKKAKRNKEVKQTKRNWEKVKAKRDANIKNTPPKVEVNIATLKSPKNGDKSKGPKSSTKKDSSVNKTKPKELPLYHRLFTLEPGPDFKKPADPRSKKSPTTDKNLMLFKANPKSLTKRQKFRLFKSLRRQGRSVPEKLKDFIIKNYPVYSRSVRL